MSGPGKQHPSEVEVLRGYDTPTLANGMDAVSDRPCTSGYTRPPVHCVTPELPLMLGRAVTLTLRSETLWPPREVRDEAVVEVFDLLAASPVPTVLVVQDVDGTGSGCLWGEVNATIAHRLGCEGVVTDGLVRDLPEVAGFGFRYHARGIGVSHAYVRVESIGHEVDVAGMTVRTGDLVHADRHGALMIPEDAVRGLPASADDVIAREQRLISWVRSEDFDPRELRRRRLDH